MGVHSSDGKSLLTIKVAWPVTLRCNEIRDIHNWARSNVLTLWSPFDHSKWKQSWLQEFRRSPRRALLIPTRLSVHRMWQIIREEILYHWRCGDAWLINWIIRVEASGKTVEEKPGNFQVGMYGCPIEEVFPTYKWWCAEIYVVRKNICTLRKKFVIPKYILFVLYLSARTF